MKQRTLKTILALWLALICQATYAQGAGGGSGLVSLLLALALLALLIILMRVFEGSPAKAGKGPSYVGNGKLVALTKGFNVLLKGEAKKEVVHAQGSTFGLQPGHFLGMSPIPKLLVQEGDVVKAGDLLFFDKNRPEVKYAAPVSGEIIEIRRGEKRSIKAIVILADKEVQYRSLDVPSLASVSRESLVAFLLESGAWPLIRQRPYNTVANPQDTPRDIYISTFDTAPLAPDLNFVVEGKGPLFQQGLDVLAKLTPGKVYLGLDANGKNAPSPVFTGATGVEKVWFSGKHPAGNVGIQIHNTNPLGPKAVVWTLGVQDVLTLGALFAEQRFDASRLIAVVGADVDDPQYVRTFQGAKVADLVKDNLEHDHVRFISGDVLSGTKMGADDFLGYYDDQLTVVREGDNFDMFGWLVPEKSRPSVSRTYLNFLAPQRRYKIDTNTRGERRAFVVTGQYEDVLPMNVFPQHALKAVINGDYENMEGLGLKEMVEEDIALCEFACTSKQPLQKILREGLDLMQAEE